MATGAYINGKANPNIVSDEEQTFQYAILLRNVAKPARTVTDAATTIGQTGLTSATANFTAADVGLEVHGAQVYDLHTRIATVTNPTTVVLDQVAKTTTTGGTITIGPDGFGATIVKRNLTTGVITTYDLDADPTAKAGLNLPVNPIDDHWSLTLGLWYTGDGRHVLFVVGNSHADGTLWNGQQSNIINAIETNVNPNPADGALITSWFDARVPANDNGYFPNVASQSRRHIWSAALTPPTSNQDNNTYHRFVHMPDKTLLYFRDQGEFVNIGASASGPPGNTSGDASHGRDWLLTYRQQGDGAFSGVSFDPEFPAEFVTTRTINDGWVPGPGGSPQLNEANRVYITGAVVEPAFGIHPGRLWVSGIWRTNDADGDYQMRPWVVYNDYLVDFLGDWYAADGSPMVMPLTYGNFGAPWPAGDFTAAEVPQVNGGTFGVPGGVAPQVSRNVGADLVIDNDGWPHFIVQNGGSGSWAGAVQPGGQSLYIELFYDGAAWQRRQVTEYTAGAMPGLTKIKGRICTILSRGDGSTGRRFLAHDIDSGAEWYIGGQIVSQMEPCPDPVAMRVARRVDLLIPGGPLGNDPGFASTGRGPRFTS